MSTYEPANRGAELLDRIRPGWHNEIDLDTLEVSDFERCVLGQLYGNYGEGGDVIFDSAGILWDTSNSVHLGFNKVVHIPEELSTDGDDARRAYIIERYAPLTTMWQELTLARRHMDDITILDNAKELAA